MKKFEWTENKIEELKQMWNKYPVYKIATYFHTTEKTISDKAKELSLPDYKSNRWTKEEEDLLRQYSKIYVTKEIAEKLGRSYVSVKKRALKLGIELHFEEDPWDEMKIQYLKENINKIPISKIQEELGISYRRILTKCKTLGIEYIKEGWTEEEIEILKKYAQSCHYSELTKVLPKRSIGAISAKAYELGIETISNYTKLRDEQAKFIKENWGKMSATEISRQLKISLGIVYRYKKELNLQNVGQKKKWTKEVIIKLKKDAKTMTRNELANKYKTSAQQISKIASENNIILIDSRGIWTDELDDELKRLVCAKLSTKEISSKMNIKSYTIRRRIIQLGLDKKKTKDPRYKWTDEEVNILINLSENKNCCEIAQILNKTERQVYDKARKLGIIIDSGKNHLWTADDTKQLMELHDKYNIHEIAKKMNRCEDTIKNKARELKISIHYSNRKMWTKEEEDNLEVYAKEFTIKEIAYLLNRTISSVSSKLKYMGLSAQLSPKFWTEEEIEQLTTLSKTNEIDEIAIIMGKSYASIRCKLYDLGLKAVVNSYKTWTVEESEQLLELLKSHSSFEVANILNRSEDAVAIKAAKLGFILDGKHRKWTEEDDEILTELWGYKPVEYIAKKLNRTVIAITNRASALALGSQIVNNYNGITITDLSNMFKVNRNTILTSWVALGLKLNYHKISNNEKYAYVTIDNLYDFLEKNQSIWDSKNLERNILGEEPIWLEEKRKRDRDIEYSKKNPSVLKQQLIQAKKYLLEETVEEPPKIIKLKK